MGFKKKTAKDQFCSDVRINEIAREAFRAQGCEKFYKEQFAGLKGELFTYIHEDDNAPEIVPGPGNGLKIADHGSISFSAPERLQNDQVVALLVAKFQKGAISIQDFAACVSTVNKGNVEQVLSPDEVKSVTKPDVDDEGKPIVQITFRASSAYKQDLYARLDNPAAVLVAEEEPGVEEAFEVTVARAAESRVGEDAPLLWAEEEIWTILDEIDPPKKRPTHADNARRVEKVRRILNVLRQKKAA